MEIREYSQYNEEEMLRLYGAAGWTAYTDDPAALKAGFANSLLTLAAYEDGEFAGIVRAVGDGATVVLIQDVLVFPQHRRRGVGAALVNALLERFPNVRQIELMTDDTPETVAFYESLGFKKMSDIGCIGFVRI